KVGGVLTGITMGLVGKARKGFGLTLALWQWGWGLWCHRARSGITWPHPMEHAVQPHQGDQHQLGEKEIGDHGKTPSCKCRNEGILETVARAPGCPQKTFIVQCGSTPLSQEGTPSLAPGDYRPAPSAGITAPADLPQPEIVPYSRNDIRNACPRCGHSAYRDKQSHRTLHDVGNLDGW